MIVPMPNVFINRTLNLKKINYIGLDMDHTLVRYNSHNFEALAHQIMLKKLVSDKAYPEAISSLKFDFDRAIRGLVIDKQRGNILKLSRYAAIRVSYHGLRPIDFNEQRRLYKSTYVDLREPNYDTVDTTFSIAFATLFAQLVDFKEQNTRLLPDYTTIASDLNFVLDRAHRDGSLKNQVRDNLDDFIIKDEKVVRGLERYKRHGKKIFILTNSDYHYSKLLLDHTITPFLKDYPHWSELFEFVITSAQKPRFFFDNLKFLRINPKDGTMTNVEGPLTPGIYQGGCASVFTNDLKLGGDEILYVGDHIYGDILRLKKDCNWRTALVVEEMSEEIQKNSKVEHDRLEIERLMDQKLPLERKVDDLISEKIETGKPTNETEIQKLLKQISEIDHKISPMIQKQQSMFNQHWGEVFRAGIEESYFAYQVERFACIYMSQLSDLLDKSPRTYFRSHRRAMAHEI
jgi:HAD superfamily 5'-nucleotidase-like hydrolase